MPQLGDICRAKCSAPARYLADERCLYVSAMCNELSEDEACPATGGEERFPLPSWEDLRTWQERTKPCRKN